MDWLEIAVSVDAETAEAVAEALSRYVPNGVAIEQLARDIAPGPDWSPDGPLEPDVIVRGYLPIDAEVESKRRQIEEALWHLRHIVPMRAPAFREVKQADWESAWKERYHVMRLGGRFVIKPSWRDYQALPDDVVLELDPGMAFGTGLHPTTQMCLSAIEQHMPVGARVLDLGTGSGILAIAAAKLGAASVLALDIDPVAVEAARENVIRNRVEGIVRVEAGSLDAARAQAQTFDFAIVNILARVIIQLCDAGLAEIMRPAGVIAFAGLIETQENDVRAALSRAGLAIIDRNQNKDWVGLVCRRE
jgi:ribosomal protein L11 methyltransferase